MSYVAKFRARVGADGLAGALRQSARFVARRVGIPFDIRPYEYVQNNAQSELHRYLGVSRADIRSIVTVGAHMGYEVTPMLRTYKNVKFRLFEASPRYTDRLKRRFSGTKRVQVFECAVSNLDGDLTFHETNLEGSGSLLEIGELGAKSYGMEKAGSYTVPARRLDSHAKEHGYLNERVDCLWIDVQGAELTVLEGASALLENVRSVFIEVSVLNPLYQGGALLADIQAMLSLHDMTMLSLGVDPSNGTGNALFVRRRH